MKLLILQQVEQQTLREIGVFHPHPRARVRAQAIVPLSQAMAHTEGLPVIILTAARRYLQEMQFSYKRYRYSLEKILQRKQAEIQLKNTKEVIRTKSGCFKQPFRRMVTQTSTLLKKGNNHLTLEVPLTIGRNTCMTSTVPLGPETI